MGLCCLALSSSGDSCVAHLDRGSSFAFTTKPQLPTLQGLNNFIIWYLRDNRPDLIKFKSTVSANDGLVYTMGMLQGPHATHLIHNDSIVVTATGNKPAILHQFDRIPQIDALMAHLNTRFPCTYCT